MAVNKYYIALTEKALESRTLTLLDCWQDQELHKQLLDPSALRDWGSRKSGNKNLRLSLKCLAQCLFAITMDSLPL